MIVYCLTYNVYESNAEALISIHSTKELAEAEMIKLKKEYTYLDTYIDEWVVDEDANGISFT